jgi:iron(III) transport system ATP-binding protein
LPEFGIEVEGLSKSFRDRRGNVVNVLQDLELKIPRGTFWVLLGPSGCGKTTLLRCLAGLEVFDRGTVRVGAYVATGGRRTGGRRQVGMVFQSYALWPHMSVAKNVAYPLQNVPRSHRMNRAQIRNRVDELLDGVKLPGLGDRMIGELSGGQQQRVALARALAAGGDTVLFDEPLSNIDAKVRGELRAELRAIQRSLGFTGVYVTHDQAEALELADQVAVMRSGKIEQLATSRDIYERPQTRYVAEFVGRSNVIRGTVQNEAAPSETVPGATGGAAVLTSIGIVQASAPGPRVAGQAVAVISRPHTWWIASEPAAASSANQWKAEVVSVTYLGEYDEYEVDIGEERVVIRVGASAHHESFAERDPVWVGVSQADCLALDDA